MEASSQDRIVFRQASWGSVAVAGLLAITTALSARRLAGAFRSPLPAPMLLVTAALFILVVWTVKLGRKKEIKSRTDECHPGKRFFSGANRQNPMFAVPAIGKDMMCRWGLPVAGLLAMYAFSWPMARGIDWIVWLPILIGEVAWEGIPTRIKFPILRKWRFDLRRGRMVRAEVPTGVTLFPEDAPTKTTTNLKINDRIRTSPPPCQDRILQTITRVRNAAGNESLYGTFCAEFMPDERTAVLHVAFCPPWMAIPDVHVEQSSGPDASIRITQIFPHGARIEVRLAQPTPVSVAITFDIAVTGSLDNSRSRNLPS